jgi:tetratricopeptide (TPR) repeat protein
MDFFNVYFFRFSFVGDHFQYLASIGAFALAGAGIVTALSNFLHRQSTINHPLSIAVKAVPFALLLALGLLSWRQSWMYLDHETLWRVTLSQNPNSFIVHNNLGNLLLRKGELDEAISHFRETMRLKPDYEVAYYNLANTLLKRGQTDDAIPLYEKAVELDPNYIGAHNNLGNVLLQKGRAREAITQYDIALKLDPNSAILCANVAKLLATNPDASIRNGPRALELALRADQLSHGGNPTFVATLGAAYAECGQFQLAIATARRALDLAWLQNKAGLAQVINAQLALYQGGHAFHAQESKP